MVSRRVPEQSINFMSSESRKCACNFCEAAHLSFLGVLRPTHVGLQSVPPLCVLHPAVHKSIHPSGTSINSFIQTFIPYRFPLHFSSFSFSSVFFGSFFLHCCCSQGGGRGVQALRQHQHHNHNITVEFITRPTLGESFNCVSCCPEALNTWSIPPPPPSTLFQMFFPLENYSVLSPVGNTFSNDALKSCSARESAL